MLHREFDLTKRGFWDLLDFGFVEKSRDEIIVKTHEIMDYLLRPGRYVLANIKEKGDHWLQRQVLLYGEQGSGKTETVNWIVERAVEKYGRRNVAAYTARCNLRALLNHEWRRRHVIILFNDDATDEELDGETIKAFRDLRHIAAEKTGLNNGLVILFTALHRFHESNPFIRTNVHLILFKNVPANPYDESVIKRFIGDVGIQALRRVEKLRDRDRRYYGYSVAWLRRDGSIGLFVNPLASKRLLEEVKAAEAAKPVVVKATDYASFEDYAVERCAAEFGDKVAHALKMRFEGLSLDEIGEVFNAPHNTVSRWLKPVREEALGYWFEDYVCSLLGVPSNPDKNRPIPDVILPDGRIMSLKCYMSPRPGITLSPARDCRPEIEEALRRSLPSFTLLVYNPLWKEAHAVEVDPRSPPRTLTIKRGDPSTLTAIPRLADQPHPPAAAWTGGRFDAASRGASPSSPTP